MNWPAVARLRPPVASRPAVARFRPPVASHLGIGGHFGYREDPGEH